ncbi:hypothetical protein GUJ93_ZPchr0012g21729 [Zizania palustris]|uniref:Uncharacterized protein n=1 Tax=Zizania palustris TaxID=103762 RepID=A0A8J5WMD4_ZIZPA|nr:hypothetical protein GUJ93_ZPchr0012g21729 [Zizania palustris]
MLVQMLKDAYGFLRRKGYMTQEMEVEIMSCKAFAVLGNFFASGATLTALLGGVKFGYKLAGVELAVVPPSTLLSVLGLSYVTAIYTGMSMNYAILQAFPGFILEKGEERTKMELANIVINKHSDEKSLVEAVKRHFFAEHLFSDQYQDGPLFRWRLRHTYVDSAFMERVKEIEVNNSDDESGSISGQRTTNFSPFGELMEDPLFCILGSPDSNIESNEPADSTGNITKRREVRSHRRSHRRRRHADKSASL